MLITRTRFEIDLVKVLSAGLFLGVLIVGFAGRPNATAALEQRNGLTGGNPLMQGPPTPDPKNAEDTKRYISWMSDRGKPIKDHAREDVNLRVGDWGFFEHGPAPGYFSDRASLDRNGHAVMDRPVGDWFDFLSAQGDDASGALKRIAWLFSATGIEPKNEPGRYGKITGPKITTSEDGNITFQGWMGFNRGEFPPDPKNPERLTITASKSGATILRQRVADL